uniref:ENT domain-containing protein n=1 Tax=Parastrongyloides trichosuri TaxID=131310 RepID=A0A0N4ZY99_PARTI
MSEYKPHLISESSGIKLNPKNYTYGNILEDLEDLGLFELNLCRSHVSFLDHKAFEACMKAFRARGNLTSYQFLILSHLKYFFSITTETAKRISRSVANDIELITIAENLNSNDDVKTNWNEFCCEQTPSAWLKFKSENLKDYLDNLYPYVDKDDVKKYNIKQLGVIERLFTVKQDPFFLEHYKKFSEEIGLEKVPTENVKKPKCRSGRPSKNSMNTNSAQKPKDNNKRKVKQENNNIISRNKSDENSPDKKEKSYVGNLGKKEMHTMICQRVIPISETYKQKIINRSIILRKRVALCEMPTIEDSKLSDSLNLSDNYLNKNNYDAIKKRKIDSPTLDESEKRTNVEMPTCKSSPIKKSSFKFIRKPPITSDKISPKIIIRPIPVSSTTPYITPRVLYKINSNSQINNDNDYNRVVPPRTLNSRQEKSAIKHENNLETKSHISVTKTLDIISPVNKEPLNVFNTCKNTSTSNNHDSIPEAFNKISQLNSFKELGSSSPPYLTK